MRHAFPTVAIAGLLSLAALLSGCDIAGSESISGPPLGGPGGNELDEASAENIVAYFYAGRPVKGLIYSCSSGGIALNTGTTDANGRFICPRTTTVAFFVGKVDVGLLKLGQVPLSIFGSSTSANNRNYVAITPATLYGASVSGTLRAEVANAYNIIYSLDAMRGATVTPAQPIYELNDEMLTKVAATTQFHDLITGTIADSPGDVSVALSALSVAYNASNSQPTTPVLTASQAEEMANTALVRAHSGLYRTTAPSIVSNDSDKVFLLSAQFVVGRGGVTTGYAYTEEYSLGATTASNKVTYLPLVPQPGTLPGPLVLADGALQGFVFGPSAGATLSTDDHVDLFGSFINDALWSDARLCKADSPNEMVPVAYCTMSDTSGGHSSHDHGRFISALGYSGGINIPRTIDTLPDADNDHPALPANYLPRTFEMQLSRYSDIQYADLINADIDETDEDKAAFGALVALPQKLRYTITADGDIVSDIDADCRDLVVVNGRYEDSDGTREYLLGRVGNVYGVDYKGTPAVLSDDRPYLTLQFSILEPDHPDYYGLSIGYPAQFRSGLFPIALEVETGNILSKKKCAAKDAPVVCTAKAEWFNDVTYLRNVYGPDQAVIESSEPYVPASTELLYRGEIYYGQVTGNNRIPGGTTICPL